VKAKLRMSDSVAFCVSQAIEWEKSPMKQFTMLAFLGAMILTFCGSVNAQAPFAGQPYQVPAGYERYGPGTLISYGGYNYVIQGNGTMLPAAAGQPSELPQYVNQLPQYVSQQPQYVNQQSQYTYTRQYQPIGGVQGTTTRWIGANGATVQMWQPTGGTTQPAWNAANWGSGYTQQNQAIGGRSGVTTRYYTPNGVMVQKWQPR
jgi:hypothetical protein